MTINGNTILTGVLGWPVGHSRSPAIHNYWFALHGIDAAYVPLPVEPGRFEEAVRGLAASGFRGVNVTVPHKESAAAVAHSRDESARAIGAANVLSFSGGEIVAGNTDWTGFLDNLRAAAPEWTAEDGPAVVLGAGGAARAVIWALKHEGVRDIRVVNRSIERARALEFQFESDLSIHGWPAVGKALDGAALLVNTTTLGMQGHPRLEIKLEGLQPGAVINDLVYAPLETGLLGAAKQQGYLPVDGLGMLLHQAAAAFATWFGVTPAIDGELRKFLLTGK